jgi:electron transfer flavoprotein alpha subunit
MAKLLWIAFDGSDAPAASGFATATGLECDFVTLTGEVPPADGLAKALAAKAAGYSHIAAVSSMQSKDVMARVAGLLDAAMVTDVISADSLSVFHRPIVAGSIIATVEVLVEPVVLTVRPAGFAKLGGSVATTSSISAGEPSRAKRLGASARGGSRPDLTQAKVIVSGGRPLKDAATFETVIGGFADALGGAAGATRAAVDSGIAANELQVGQTGKIVAPDLYIAAGISGSTQHMAGIKDSKIIVAINKDPDAPIFEFADLGLVADLFVAIPEIRSKLGK